MTGNDIRKIVIEQSLRTGASHIGSCLSVADILAVLYTDVLKPEDRFILSKGHSAYALYAALYLSRRINIDELESACERHHHPKHTIPGVEFSTGSLGQGITYAVGVAEALRRKGGEGRVYCLVSDAECQEGSVWEAARVAQHQRLGNLTVIVDDNGMQALGPTGLRASSLIKRWEAFGFYPYGCMGHETDQVYRALTFRTALLLPLAVLAHTRLGEGVSWMQDELAWHYKSLTPELAAQALGELNA